MKRRLIGLIGLLVLTIFITSIGWAQTATGPVAPPSCNCAVVTIKGFHFAPNQLTISPGSIVTWVNRDRSGHNIVVNQITSPTLQIDELWSFEFKEVGTYNYKCGHHPFMSGTIIVQ